MDDAERLEAIEEALDRLRRLSSDHVILVEGSKDVSALEAVGVTGDMFCVQSGGGTSERPSTHGGGSVRRSS